MAKLLGTGKTIRVIGSLIAVVCSSVCQEVTGTTLHVDRSVPASGDGRSWQTAFATIQEGIDAASDGDTVMVARGTYLENIHFRSKNIALRSTAPADPAVVQNTIIDGNTAGSVVTFAGTEDQTCTLSGFTIRNGKASDGGGICGGTRDNPTHATIRNNIISGNSAVHGGGLAYCAGDILDNLVSDNSAWHKNISGYGGGLYSCDGTIEGNHITGNSALHGAAAYDCQGTIRANTISDNSARWTGAISGCHGMIERNAIHGNTSERDGAGLYHCGGTIQNNTIYANTAGRDGGGVHYCEGTIQNNTIHANSAERGGGLYYCKGTIRNCIIWANAAGVSDPQFSSCTEPTYSSIQNWSGAGQGNTFSYPHFVAPERGDFHLRSWSPCVDGGDPDSPFSNEPEPNGARVNMGAYGNTAEAASKSPDADADGLPDDWEMHYFANLDEDAAGDSDNDRIPNLTEYRYEWDPSTPAQTLVENLTQGAWYEAIQPALLECSDADDIVVHPGVYTENIYFTGKNVVLRSTDPSDPAVVAATIIDGAKRAPVITLHGTEDETSLISGLAIQNGSRGIHGEKKSTFNSASIEKNVIVANSGPGIAQCSGVVRHNTITGNSGGGLLQCGGPIQNNTISDNSIRGNGGGLNDCDGTIENNFISHNSATEDGGGLYACGGIIQNNIVRGNSAEDGGGLAECHGTIRLNTICDNLSAVEHVNFGGGLYLCNGTIENNVVYGNSASDGGGGLCNCSGTIQNNTIVGNTPGGIWSCRGKIRNCIIWGNGTVDGSQVSASSKPTYSCIQNWTAGGQGNIFFDPYFVDEEGGDFHLSSWSPCIDAGDPDSPFSNEPEPNGGRINMGAYGNTPDAACKSPDSDSDYLPDDWEIFWFGTLDEGAADDFDDDRTSNLREYRYGWEPNVRASTLVENVSQGEWYQTIQAALFECQNGDEIVVPTGIYRENICLGGKNIVLRSADPADPKVVSATVIDGGGNGPVVTFSGTEDESCFLSGFTIQNGNIGIYSHTAETQTHATIENNIIRDNSGPGIGWCDGIIRNNTVVGNSGTGIRGCDGLIQNNTISENQESGLAGCNGSIEDNLISGNSSSTDGGGLYKCDGTIRNNLISGNSALGHWPEGFGGGLAYCQGSIEANTITSNSAQYGGGLANCKGPIENNTISGNSASNGGGIACSDGIIRTNVISKNLGDYGAALFSCNGVIENNLISDNQASLYGGGLASCNATLLNNTIAGNSAQWYGGGLTDCTATIANCIVWGNSSADAGKQTYKSTISSTYSCIQNWTEGGEGNIAEDPQFAHQEAGDYHLKPFSPCIDTGQNFHWFLWPQRDLEGNCRLVGKSVDMGCYECGSSLDSDGDLFSDEHELAAGTDPAIPDSDADGLRDGLEILRGSDPSVPTPPGTLHVPFDAPTIQASLFLALNGDEIIVSPGTYRENIRFFGFDVILRSSDPENPDIVSSTIMDGGGIDAVVTLTGTESEECVIAGFTIQNGGGYGIRSSTDDKYSLATIRNNAITGNAGSGLCDSDGLIENNVISHNSGIGIWDCDGLIRNNVISGNHGEGLFYCDGIIRSNTISENFLGGLHLCDATIENNAISANRCTSFGAGLSSCDGLIKNNLISGNTAGYGGGGLFECGGIISNNTITQNSTSGHGGGMKDCRGRIEDNIITANHAGENGGGLSGCQAFIINNLISGNKANEAGGGLSGCGREDDSGATIHNNTIIGNSAKSGGGLSHCLGIIRENTITANSARDQGGGLHDCAGLIENNTVSGNSADYGAGIADCDGIVRNNSIAENYAFDSGGGLFHCDGSIRHNDISSNAAVLEGGGLYRCDATISENIISLNSAGFGGGLCGCHGAIHNNTIGGNFAALFGGGLNDCDGMIRNNVIVRNSANRGGGFFACNGSVRYCIIWDNSASDFPQVYGSSNVAFCCIRNWTEGGEENIADDPLFLDPNGLDDDPDTYPDNDYRLSPNSPCIDAGDYRANDFPRLDADGKLRVAFGHRALVVDIGAYEYNSLPFAITRVERDESGIRLTWNSQPHDTYTVFCCPDIKRQQWVHATIYTIESDGASTSWTDPDTTGTRKFFKIEME